MPLWQQDHPHLLQQYVACGALLCLMSTFSFAEQDIMAIPVQFFIQTGESFHPLSIWESCRLRANLQ